MSVATFDVPAPARPWREPSALPGFRGAFGFTLIYAGLIILLPLAALVARPWEHGVGGAIAAITQPRTLAALRLSFGAATVAALANVGFGLLIAWVLTRYDFPGQRILDAIVDLPFALPTAVAGIALAALYGPNGPIGSLLAPLGIKVAYTPTGVVVALLAVGLPFVVRTVQPVLLDLDAGLEEAAHTLGASRAATFFRVVAPALAPSLLTGFALAFARGAGEYGSVIFISGNLPGVSEIAPLVIVTHLESYDYAGAAAVGLAMLAVSVLVLSMTNWTQVALAREDGVVIRSAPRLRKVDTVGAKLLVGLGVLWPALVIGAPLATVIAGGLSKGAGVFLAALTEPDAVSAIKLTVLVAAIAVPLNLVFGLAAAWSIAKFEFRGKALLMTLIDLPLSMSPVISGLVWVLVFGARGWFGPELSALGIHVIFAVPGIVLGTILVTVPLIARELIPLLTEQGSEEELAATTLGAGGWSVFFHVTLPNVRWALLNGVLLCNARAMGEFGAVSVLSGHIRGLTETLPLHVEALYNDYDFAGAFACATLLAGLAVVTLIVKALLERRSAA